MPLCASYKQKLKNWLRLGEKWTKTDNVYLAKNAGYLSLMHVVNVFFGFLLYLLISHFLPKEIYGQYKYFLTWFGLFGIATLTGTEAAVTKSVAEGYDGALRQGFRQKLISGFIGSFALLIGALYYIQMKRLDFALALALLALIAPWIYASNVYASFLSGKKRFDIYTKYSVICSFISSLGMMLAVLFLRNPVLLLTVFLVTNLVTIIAYVATRRRQQAIETNPKLFSYSLHLSGLDILGTIANNIDSVLIFHLLGPSALAVYSLAVVPVDQLKGFLKGVPSIAMPKFSQHSFESIRPTLKRRILLFILMIAGLMGVYILLAPLFFRLFFPTYVGSVAYSQIYAVSIIFASPISLLLTLFMAQGMRKQNSQVNIISYSLQILFLILGAYYYGLWGVIFARVLSRCVTFIIIVFILRRVPTT